MKAKNKACNSTVRLVIDFDIDGDALVERRKTAEQVMHSIQLQILPSSDGYKLIVGKPGVVNTGGFFLCDGRIVSKTLLADISANQEESNSSLQAPWNLPAERMVEIASAAIDSFGELLNGRSLYDALSGSLKMDDDEILAAGFSSLKEYMTNKKG